MALANIKYNLSNVDDQVYITIKNDKGLLEILFRGLFIVARRHLGYNPNASSFPFITGYAPDQNDPNLTKSNKDYLARVLEQDIYITADTEKHKKNKVSTLAVNGQLQYINKAIEIMNVDCEPDDAFSGYSVSLKDVYMALIEDYWDGMLAFAKENRYYCHRWESQA
jgi:hypothetical protein